MAAGDAATAALRADGAMGASSASSGAAPSTEPDVLRTWTRVSDGVHVRTASVVDEHYTTLEWVVVRLDVRRARLTAERSPDDTLQAVARDRRVAFVIDAGFFEPDHRPSGLLITEGRELGSAAPQGGSGTLVIRAGLATLVDAAAPLAREPRIDLAVQCGPRLIERDGSVGIHRDDGARFARTAACIRDGGRTLDLIATWRSGDPMRGPGLHAFSRMLAAASPVGDRAGCEMALNLDGGPSTGVLVRAVPAARHPALGPVPYVLVVRD